MSPLLRQPLKQKLARQAQTDKRVLLVESLENSQRLGETHLIELGHEMVVLQAAQARVDSADAQYVKLLSSGLPPQHALVV